LEKYVILLTHNRLPRLTENSSKSIRKVRLGLVGIQMVRWNKVGTEAANDYTFFYGNGNENHEFRNRIFHT
jgi:hypothetical protein